MQSITTTKFAHARIKLRSQRDEHLASIAAIDRELSDIDVAERVMQTYGIAHEESPQGSQPANPNDSVRAAALKQLEKTVTKRERILQVALEMLAEGPLQTEKLKEALEAREITIAGDDHTAQIRNISSYLSRAQKDLGISASRQGWVLNSQKGEGLKNADGSPQVEAFSVQPIPPEEDSLI